MQRFDYFSAAMTHAAAPRLHSAADYGPLPSRPLPDNSNDHGQGVVRCPMASHGQNHPGVKSVGDKVHKQAYPRGEESTLPLSRGTSTSIQSQHTAGPVPGFPEGTWLLIAILILKRSSLQPLQFCLQPQAGPTLQAGILKVKLNQAHLSSASTPQIDMVFLGVDSPSLRAGVTAFTGEVLLVMAPEERLLYPDQVSWWWATVLLVGWKPFGSQPWMSNSLVKGTLLLNTCQQKLN